MKPKLLLLSLFLGAFALMFAQDCGTIVFQDTFDEEQLPAAWTELNTSGQVSVEDGRLKFDFTSSLPGASRTFDPETKNLSFSFDVSSSRNWVKTKVDLRSSTGAYITGLIIGNDGVKNIQYATSLDASGLPSGYTGALIDGTYGSNTTYSVSISVNFDDQTLDFYEGDNVGATRIPFLETAQDLAQFSIQQVSMYSGNGQFYFDNVTLTYLDVIRTSLASNLALADELVDGAILSPKYGYSDSAYYALKAATDSAETVLYDCDITQELVDQTVATLEEAITTFEASYTNEPVLSLYSGYDFIGAVREYECGYYNGNLGDFEDVPVSFKLEQGYMATFAQDVDGQGYSKVYIAQDAPLAINFPEELQQSISFMRVSPWYAKQKKGSCGKGADVQDALESDWYYAWGMTNGSSTAEREFVPMSWSGGDGFSGLAACRTAGQNMAFNHHLAFNEPDLEDQSNMTVEKALEVYPQLLASGLRLGSPAVANVNYSLTKGEFNEGAWIVEFMDSCMARGYRVDFIAVHDYIRRSPSQYVTRFQALADRYNLPVWVTEYNYGNPNIGSAVLEDSVELVKIKAINQKFDETDFIERYSMFYFQPSQGQLTIFETRSPIVLNDLGEYYRDHESPYPSYAQEVYEEGPYIETAIESPQSFDRELVVSPNPVLGGELRLMAQDGRDLENISLSLYDVSGKALLPKTKGTTLDVSSLKSGFYLLRIENEQGDWLQKVMIQNH